MASAKKSKAAAGQEKVVEQTLSREHRAVSKWLSQVEFAPRLFGVDEADVWRKIERLCELYEDALEAEREKNEKLVLLLRAKREVSGGRKQPRKNDAEGTEAESCQEDEAHG